MFTNRAQLITDLKNLIGPGNEVDDGDLAVWVNDAYMTMVDEIAKVNPDFYTKVSTTDLVAGQGEYDLPTDFDKASRVEVYTDSQWYRALPLNTINGVPVSSRDDAQGFATNEPVYYLTADNVGLRPIPSAAANEGLKLWYVYVPTELSADSDEPAFPKKYHHIIKFGAYANYLDQDDEHVAAENMRRRFDRKVEAMVESMSTNQVDEPRSVEISNGLELFDDSL